MTLHTETHYFEVEVEVQIEIPEGDEYDRTDKQYAEAALNSVQILPDTENLDGWADLHGNARVTGVYNG